MNHFGIPGPGGSMGMCAVCGKDFCAGVLKDLCGLPSGISSFDVGFVTQTLYAHDPKCKDAVIKSFDSNDAQTVHDALPEGPLRKCLAKAIEAQEVA